MMAAFLPVTTPLSGGVYNRPTAGRLCPLVHPAGRRAASASAAQPSRSQPPPLAMTWIEKSASVSVEAPRGVCWSIFSNLERQPAWSPWLKSVKVDSTDPAISRWTLAARGVEVSWQARNTSVIAGELIAWQSMDGLSNRGSVKFEDVPPAQAAVVDSAAVPAGRPAAAPADLTAVTLSVAFDVPAPIARVLDNAVVGKYVEQTLLADLRRYRTEVLKEVRGAARAGAARAR
ncbi:hypothetical protein MMPV_008465 [Pyropia vietnamensis]